MSTVFIATLTATITTDAALPDAIAMLTNGPLYPCGDEFTIAAAKGKTNVTITVLTVGTETPGQPDLAVDTIGVDRIEPPVAVGGMSEPTVCIHFATGDGSDDCEIVFDATGNNGDNGRCPTCAESQP